MQNFAKIALIVVQFSYTYVHITISRNGIFLDSLSPPIFNSFESISHFDGW